MKRAIQFERWKKLIEEIEKDKQKSEQVEKKESCVKADTKQETDL